MAEPAAHVALAVTPRIPLRSTLSVASRQWLRTASARLFVLSGLECVALFVATLAANFVLHLSPNDACTASRVRPFVVGITVMGYIFLFFFSALLFGVFDRVRKRYLQALWSTDALLAAFQLAFSVALAAWFFVGLSAILAAPCSSADAPLLRFAEGLVATFFSVAGLAALYAGLAAAWRACGLRQERLVFLPLGPPPGEAAAITGRARPPASANEESEAEEEEEDEAKEAKEKSNESGKHAASSRNVPTGDATKMAGARAGAVTPAAAPSLAALAAAAASDGQSEGTAPETQATTRGGDETEELARVERALEEARTRKEHARARFEEQRTAIAEVEARERERLLALSCQACFVAAAQMHCETCARRFCPHCFQGAHATAATKAHRWRPMGAAAFRQACGRCEEHSAELSCEKCGASFCKRCDDVVHRAQARRGHKREVAVQDAEFDKARREETALQARAAKLGVKTTGSPLSATAPLPGRPASPQSPAKTGGDDFEI